MLSLPPPRRPEPRQPPERPAGGHQPGLGVGNFLAGLCLGTGGVEVRPKLVGDGLRRLQVALHIIQAVAQRVGLGTLAGQRRVGPVRTGTLGIRPLPLPGRRSLRLISAPIGRFRPCGKRLNGSL